MWLFRKRKQQKSDPEALARQFELAKLDYARLATQEQSIMNDRLTYWIVFFSIIAGPTGYAGIVGIQGSVFVLALVAFFLCCLSLHIKHSELVLKNDVRGQMKELAAAWGFSNHDSKFSKEAQKGRGRYWFGWYKIARAAAYLMAEAGTTAFSCWYAFTNGFQILSLIIATTNALFLAVTFLCLR